MKKVGFIGLGVMGGPMAGHLVNKGYDVIVYNRTLNKAKLWTQTYNGKFAESPKEVAANSEVIFTCVGNDDDVLSVVKGEKGILSGITSNCILVDHTTASANLARKLYKEFHSQGLGFIDAPVSGGQAGAENGLLSIMCGGDEKDYVRVLPILKSYGKKISLIGKSGSGQLAKMVNQICIAGLVQALSEGINFGINAKLDMTKVLDVIEAGAAGSWQMSNRGSTMIKNEFNFGFAVNWMIKDLNICIDEAKNNNSKVEITSLIKDFYKQVRDNGGGMFDTSSLITLLRKD